MRKDLVKARRRLAVGLAESACQVLVLSLVRLRAPHPPNIAPCEAVNPRGCGKPKGRPHLCSNPNWVAVCPHVCSKRCKAAKDTYGGSKNALLRYADDRKVR